MMTPTDIELGKVMAVVEIFNSSKEGIDGLDKANLIIDKATQIMQEFVDKYGKEIK